MKEIKLGKVNDAIVYAVSTTKGFEPIKKEDLEYCTPEFKIYCDSGIYPGITNFEQYICNEAYAWLME